MADDHKKNTPEAAAAPATEDSPGAISPAPTEVADGKAAPAAAGANDPSANVQTEALSDGTVPTVLHTGANHKSIAKGRASISTIYRRADVLTTVITFVIAAVSAGAIIGGYAYLNRPKTAVTPPPKVTNLDKADLAKLGAFFEGNSAGNASQVLTINSASLFRNRVAMSSDVKATGSLDVSGPTSLTDLSVTKTTTLGITSIKGQLVVAGPTNFQSPAVFGAGGSVSGNFSVTGNGTYGGSVSAGTLNASTISVTTINLAGHLSITGPSPSAVGTGLGSSATIEGNDSSGTVTVTVGPCSSSQCVAGGQLVIINFHTPYPRTPHITISPIGAAAARLLPYVQPGASSFTIGAATINNVSTTTYSFTYWAVQ
jgi:hypothetical protein